MGPIWIQGADVALRGSRRKSERLLCFPCRNGLAWGDAVVNWASRMLRVTIQLRDRLV